MASGRSLAGSSGEQRSGSHRRTGHESRTGRSRLRAAAFWLVVALAAGAVAGGGLYAWAGYRSTAAPEKVVRGYFTALAGGDAAAALSYGDLPGAPSAMSRRWLTRPVLAEQLRRAPIRDVRVGAADRSGDVARVRYRYRLGTGPAAREVHGAVEVRDTDSGWRMAAVAEPVRLRLTAAAGLASLAGARVPAGPVLLFPGAPPVRFVSPWLAPAASVPDVRVGAVPRTVAVTPTVTPAARRTVIRAVRGRVAQCLRAGPSAAGGSCPATPRSMVPDSLRGTVSATDSGLRVRVAPGPLAGVAVTGTLHVLGQWRRLDYQNVARRHSGPVLLPIRATVTAPVRAGQPTAVIFAAAPSAFAPAGTPTPPGAGVPTPPGGAAAPEYWLRQWHVDRLWRAGTRGQGVTIAEIDTGVDASLPVLAGRVEPGIDLGPAGGDGRIDRDTDPYGHGTSMATIMVGRPGRFGIRGLAPGATVLPVAVPLAGTTDESGDDHVAGAIRWAAAHGADIISMSLGGVRRPSSGAAACPVAEQRAIFAALRAGAIVFAAGGNRGPTDNAVEEPGVCLGVVTVGAVDRAGHVADFSSRHPYLTLTAPGVNVASIGASGVPYAGDGTSQATALASAGAALVWSAYPDLTGRQVVARLLATLDDLRTRPDPAYGYGRLDVARAVAAAVPPGAPNPVFDLADRYMRRPAGPAAPAGSAAVAALPRYPAGRVEVGAAAAVHDARVVRGLSVAAAGLFVLLVLGAALALRRTARRRHP